MLTGSTARQAVGQFKLRRGRLSIMGRRSVFSRGTINFSGSLVPNLDFAADSTVGDDDGDDRDQRAGEQPAVQLHFSAGAAARTRCWRG